MVCYECEGEEIIFIASDSLCASSFEHQGVSDASPCVLGHVENTDARGSSKDSVLVQLYPSKSPSDGL